MKKSVSQLCRAMLRLLGGWLCMLCLMGTLAASLAVLAGSGTFLRGVLADPSLLQQEQQMIDEAAQRLAQEQHVQADALAPWVTGAAGRYTRQLADWWQSLWHDPEAELALPEYFNAVQEREAVAAVMADEAFAAATEPARLKAVARDEVIWTLEQEVTTSVLPLRRSLMELALIYAAGKANPASVMSLMPLAAGVLATAAVLLLLLCRRGAGCILVSTGVVMVLLSVPVWLLDPFGLLHALNPLAASQLLRGLTGLLGLWYMAAIALLAAGTLLLRVRRRMEMKEAA